MPRTNDMERVMSDLNERLKSSVARLTDTAMMTTQYPSWLCSEMEKAAELHVECIAALSAQPDAGSDGHYVPGDNSPLDLAVRAYEFAAYEHGKTDHNALAVDAAAKEMARMINALAARQPVGSGVAIYQVRYRATDRWTEVSKEGYDYVPSWDRRVLYTAPPAPAAVPVDGVSRQMIRDAIRSAYDAGYNDSHRSGDNASGYNGLATEQIHGEALATSLSIMAEAARHARHQPPAAGGDA